MPPLYRIFYSRRFIDLAPPPHVPHHSKLIIRQGVAVIVYSSEPIDDNVDLTHYMTGVTSGRNVFYCQAKNPKALIDHIFSLPMFKAGKHPSAWINCKEGIVQLPDCEYLRTSSEDRYICGEEDEDGNGEFGMCILEGFDGLPSCPIRPFLHLPQDLLAQGLVTRTTVRGIPFFIPVPNATPTE